MPRMTCDADCTRAGWVQKIATTGLLDVHVSHAPDADLDGDVLVFDHDEQEMIRLHGWLWTFEPV